ncbi:MAG TPA: endonuclease/exonuclease/phosphatase family protein [Bdellovibrionota bacterium]|nr:endonuclease/exonuclease/phosphatase family protein [Bdellovibrionota bacterium]
MLSTAAVLTLVTMNLHGYHPMDEAPRFFEDRQGKLTPADPSPFYFHWDEVTRGNRKRLDRLARQIMRLHPQVVALQEVGAGSPSGGRDCNSYHSQPAGDADDANTAARLLRRLAPLGYRLWTACRGNTGWITDGATFKDSRMVRARPGGKREVVFDFGSNPYPRGMIVEGMALLVRSPWRVVAHEEWGGTVEAAADHGFVQIAALALENGGPDSPWFLMANIHGGHKVAHFEQDVALRDHLARLRDEWRSHVPGIFAGVLASGDFNAHLYRPAESPEPSLVPWQMSLPGQYQFDLTGAADSTRLENLLLEMNSDPDYKPWATITDGEEARRRVVDAVAWLERLQRQGDVPVEVEAVETAAAQGRCPAGPSAPPLQSNEPLPFEGGWACHQVDRIDHIFLNPRWEIRRAWVQRPEDDADPLVGLSDHPSVYAEIGIR